MILTVTPNVALDITYRVDRLAPGVEAWLERGASPQAVTAALTSNLPAQPRNPAGHIAHRLLRHGAEPVALSVAADDRGRTYRRPGFTSAPVTRTCTFQATAARGGVHVTASRTVSKTGIPSTSSPPFPGVTPATTFVP